MVYQGTVAKIVLDLNYTVKFKIGLDIKNKNAKPEIIKSVVFDHLGHSVDLQGMTKHAKDIMLNNIETAEYIYLTAYQKHLIADLTNNTGV